jgi:hypothetical protein
MLQQFRENADEASPRFLLHLLASAIGPERQFAASQQYSRYRGSCGHTSSILRWCTTRYSKPPAGLFMAGHHPKQTEARNRARKEEAIRAECLLCLPSIDRWRHREGRQWSMVASSICVGGEASSVRCRRSQVHRYCGCCARPA